MKEFFVSFLVLVVFLFGFILFKNNYEEKSIAEEKVNKAERIIGEETAMRNDAQQKAEKWRQKYCELKCKEELTKKYRYQKPVSSNIEMPIKPITNPLVNKLAVLGFPHDTIIILIDKISRGDFQKVNLRSGFKYSVLLKGNDVYRNNTVTWATNYIFKGEAYTANGFSLYRFFSKGEEVLFIT